MRCIAAFICLLTVSGSWAVAQSDSASKSPQRAVLTTRDALGLHLTVGKQTVHVTEPVTVNIDVINRSEQAMFLFPSEPWAMTTLAIFKDGKPYLPSGPRRTGYHFRSIWAWPKLEPGETYTMRWHYGEYYYSIFYWGYGSGELPVGHYEIIAHPWSIGGRFSTGKYFRADNTIASNAVTLDVVP